MWGAPLGGFNGLVTSWASGRGCFRRPTVDDSSPISFLVSRLL